MDGAILSFFAGHEGALPLYAALEDALRENIGAYETRVQKTQISFYAGHMFACVSFLPVRRAASRPKDFITVTFGLPYAAPSPRIDGVCEARPNRWTHHVLIGKTEEIDGELMGWLREAAAFSQRKS